MISLSGISMLYLSSNPEASSTISSESAPRSSTILDSSVMSSTTSSSSAIKVVIHLDGDVLVDDGDGTEGNPYTIKTAYLAVFCMNN